MSWPRRGPPRRSPCTTAGRSPPTTAGAGPYAPALFPPLPQRIEAGRRCRPAPTRGAARCREVAQRPRRGAATGQSRRGRLAGRRRRHRACRCAAPANACAPSILPPSPAPALREVSVREPRIRIVPAARRRRSSPPPRGWSRRDVGTLRRHAALTRPAAISSDALADGKRRRHCRHRRHRQRPQRRQRADTGARRPARRARHGAYAGRDRRFRICRRQGRCCCCRAGSMPRWRLARSSAGACCDGSPAAAIEDEPAETLPLARKVTSTVGLAELVPVRRTGDMAEPLATQISAAVGAGALRRLDPGAGRQRRLFRRRAGSGKAVAMRIVA